MLPAAMTFAVVAGPYPRQTETAPEENDMTATYTFDVFSSLDGYGSYDGGDWGGYWGKQGPEFLDRRLALYGAEQRMVLGANTFRQFAELLGPSVTPDGLDPVNSADAGACRPRWCRATLEGPLDWPDATLASGDAVDVVARLKEESRAAALERQPVAEPVADGRRSGRLRAADGLPGHHRSDRRGSGLPGCADFDLELVEQRTLDGHTQELIYRPTLH